MQDKMTGWLRSLPGLENLTTEWVGDLPGCAGLFYRGMEIVSRTADILGREILRKRARWTLVTNEVRTAIPPEEVPVLGLLQKVQVEQGRLVHLDEMQIPRWETELNVEFTAVPEHTDTEKEATDAEL